MINKIVLFDLDGVLVDLVKIHHHALNTALEFFNYPAIENFDLYNGLPTKVKLEMLGVDSRHRQSIFDYKQNLTIYYIKDLIRPDREKLKLARHLNYNGFSLGCVTNSIKATANIALERSMLDIFMDVIISNEDVNHPKPDPEPYMRAIFELGSTTGIAIEDTDKGEQSASSAGLRVIRVAGPAEVNMLLYDRIYNEYTRADGGGWV